MEPGIRPHVLAVFAAVLLSACSTVPVVGGRTEPAPSGYLPAGQLTHLTSWLPPAPAPGSAAEAEDWAVFAQSRAVLATPRGQQAAEDDVFEDEALLQRFEDVLGARLTRQNAPALVRLIGRMKADANAFVAPIKRQVGEGGRIRPFVARPTQPSCLSPRDMAGRRHVDIDLFSLDKTGSYPSTHALMGMLIGLSLSEAWPDRADAIMQRGLEFGQSRVICGFHFKSDIDAGRLVAAALFARLHADAAFRVDFAAARVEVLQAAGQAPVKAEASARSAAYPDSTTK